MENQLIIKRNQQTEPFNADKIMRILNLACRNFPLDPRKPLDNLLSALPQQISSSQLMNDLILATLNLTSVEEPEWKNAAGRLKLFALYKQVSITRGTNHQGSPIPYDYLRFLDFAVKHNVYSADILNHYDSTELSQAAAFINPDYDLLYDYAGINLLIKRYLCEYNDHIVELPQDMFLSIALLLEQNESPATRMAKVRDTYNKLANRKISLGTPLLMNLRRPNGNLSSCFITMMDDNRDSIFYVIDQISAISNTTGIPLPSDWFPTLLRLPDVLNKVEIQELSDEEWEVVNNTIHEALNHLIDFRVQEGAALEKKFNEKLDNIAALLESIKSYEEERVQRIKERITDALEKIIGVDYDKNRLEQELIYYIEKLDINEEKQRLANHLKYFRETMNDGHGQGKKLGFIAQEMGREINTTGSKSNHAEMQKIVVRMKDELEQIKEQVLNVM